PLNRTGHVSAFLICRKAIARTAPMNCRKPDLKRLEMADRRTMQMATVFVVAPDAQLRASLEFLFQTEGMKVVSTDRIDQPPPLDERQTWCAVIDENALSQNPKGWEHLARITHPVILLTDRMRFIPESYTARAIPKPHLGENLVQAVIEACAG